MQSRLSACATRGVGFLGVFSAMLTVGMLFLSAGLQQVVAETESVPLKRLNIKESLYLPTVTAEQRVPFTKPRSWALQSDSQVIIDFQHAHELLPERSWLAVLVNEQLLTRVPLTHQNEVGSTLKLPLPVGILKDENELIFRVEQHYTNLCEDPLDPSLWTQVLRSSRIQFSYTPQLPVLDVYHYPYPIVDPLAYSPAKVRFVVSGKPSNQTLQAVAYLNTHLGQKSQKKELFSRLSFDSEAVSNDEHLIVVGTPKENTQIRTAPGGYAVINGEWHAPQTNQVVDPRAGLIFFERHPQYPNRAKLTISANSPEGVLQAARYLTTPKLQDAPPHISYYQVPSSWQPSSQNQPLPPRFVETQTRSFKELGLPTQFVEKINAPPIIYKFPIVGDFRRDGTKLFLDLVYSYGPGPNPTYSSLEVRMNDIPIGNIPLQNEKQGENRVRASIPISNELIRPLNEMVLQFHLTPDKYGYCRDNYIDRNWGRIHDDSQFRVEGPVGLRLPEVSLLGETGYPYTRRNNFSETHLALPAQLNRGILETMLAVTGRLGRLTLPTTDLKLSVSVGKGDVPGDKDLLAIEQPPTASDWLSLLQLQWPLNGKSSWIKQFKVIENSPALILDDGSGVYLEQRSPDAKRVYTLISVKSAKAYQSVIQWLDTFFTTDDPRMPLPEGSLQHVSGGGTQDQDVRTVGYRFVPVEKAPVLPWYYAISWPAVVAAVLVLFLLFLISPILVRKLRQMKR